MTRGNPEVIYMNDFTLQEFDDYLNSFFDASDFLQEEDYNTVADTFESTLSNLLAKDLSFFDCGVN